MTGEEGWGEEGYVQARGIKGLWKKGKWGVKVFGEIQGYRDRQAIPFPA